MMADSLFRSYVLLAAAVAATAPLSARSEPSPGPVPAGSAGGSAVAKGSFPAAENVVLDRRSYFRIWSQFGPMRLNSDALKSEGAKLFGPRLSRVEQYVKRLLAGKGYDWSQTDWRDVACYRFYMGQMGDDVTAVGVLSSLPPPADWMQPEFDDHLFDRQYLGFPKLSLEGQEFRATNTLLFRGLYLRTYFQVHDPSSGTRSVPDTGGAGELTVRLAYRGGARVFINGEEIARGHLPDAPPGPETFATDYPAEAYVAAQDELPGKPSFGDWIGDLRCPFDMAPVDERDRAYRTSYGNTAVNRAGWDRLMRLRDRVLGPVVIPAWLLRKGTNVLAIELRTSRYHPIIVHGARTERFCGWLGDMGHNVRWDHVGLVNVEVRGASAAVPSCTVRPPGFQAWVDDLHERLYDRDFNPPGWPAGRVRFVGGRNGTYAAQLGVGTDRPLVGLRATAGDLAGPGGAKIPAPALKVQYLVGHGLDELAPLGSGRCLSGDLDHCWATELALSRYSDGRNLYGPCPKGVSPEEARRNYVRNFKFFDHVSPSPPESVPAGTCQPIWLSLRIPADAPAGVYRGKLTIRAEGDSPILADHGCAAGTVPVLEIPLEAEVIAWRVPDPQEFQTFVQSEQSPYGVARAYKLELWSPEHWRLIESSFRQLARIGNRWLFVPVLMGSELGNREDTLIRWIRRKDGTLAFDYALMDRYLALAGKIQGRPKVICFDVMQAVPAPAEVKVLDETTGREEVVGLGPEQEAARGPLWRAFARSLCEHMKTLGLEDVMYWGQTFDDVPDKGLIPLLAQAAPGVAWTCAGHARGPDATFRVAARAYGVDLTQRSFQGWKNPFIHLLMGRTGGSVICVEGCSTPFSWRVMCDRAIYCGFNGLGRIGADYFNKTWFDGVKGGYWCMVGRSCVQTLWPGAGGVESSTRVEAMLEGIQEAEARIYLEQMLDRKLLPDDLAREVQTVLDDHFRGTLHVGAGGTDYGTMDIACNWQERSRRLYLAAAKVAEKTGLDVDRTSLGETSLSMVYTESVAGSTSGAPVAGTTFTGGQITVPALGQTRLALRLRNWSGRPRAWKASSADPWIVPEKAQGTAAAHEELGILLDGKTLTPGSDVSGTLEVSDVAAGTTYPVRILARVERGVELKLRREIQFWTGGGAGAEQPNLIRYVMEPVLNPPVDGSDAKEFTLLNRTPRPQAWKIASDWEGLAAEPASGLIPPLGSVPVKIVARPRQKEGAALEPILTLTAAEGAVADQYKIKVYVIPPYRRPAVPAGHAVYLNDLDRKRMTWHVDAGYSRDWKGPRPWWIEQGDGQPFYSRVNRTGDKLEGVRREDAAKASFQLAGKTFARGLWASPQHETTYNIQGAGFVAFAAEVGTYANCTRERGGISSAATRVNFEIYVDGELRTQSGLMTAADGPRLLVAGNLQAAKQIKLVTRRDDLVSDAYTVRTWADPRFIEAR